jgi:DNA-binding transcriptional regulator LsrR (DeoR family)
MRKTHEILRLHFESHLAPRQIASICKVAKSTVQRYLERLKAAGLSWPLPSDLDDLALERRLFPRLRWRRPSNVACRTARRFTES